MCSYVVTSGARSLTTMASSTVIVCLLAFLTCSVNAQRQRDTIVSVGTFNTLLIPGMSAFAERKELFIETLQRRRSGAPDILCLQEVFRRSDAKEIFEAVRNDYPFYASFEDLEEGAGIQRACTPQEAGTAAACLLQFCANLTSAQTADEQLQLLNCSTQNCLRFSQLSQSCQSCLIFEAQDLPDGVDLFTHCATNVPANDYTAPYGLLLLSRRRLLNITASDFLDPPFVTYLPRGYIAAEVENLGLSVLCTHLTAQLPSSVDYPGPLQFSQYAEQQANEITVIHEFVESNSNCVLLGDFNHGPATPGLSWYLPLNYGLMTARGLLSISATFCGQCTSCSNNILTGGQLRDLHIDHIYIPANLISSVRKVMGLFDTIRTPTTNLPLSDHYGVRAELYVTFRRRAVQRLCPTSNTLGRVVPFLNMEDIDQHTQDFCPAEATP